MTPRRDRWSEQSLAQANRGSKCHAELRIVVPARVGRLQHIPVGVAHKNRKVRLLVAGADVRVITEDGELLRALTLDPTRSYQPLGGRWPVHKCLATGVPDVLRQDGGAGAGIRTPDPRLKRPLLCH